MVKRYTWDEEGYPPDGMELVAAADYDALARDLAACKIARDGFTKASDDAYARIRELEEELDVARSRACGWHDRAATLKAALRAAKRLFDEALPKFNWGASALDANAIRLLNEVPPLVDAALALPSSEDQGVE